MHRAGEWEWIEVGRNISRGELLFSFRKVLNVGSKENVCWGENALIDQGREG